MKNVKRALILASAISVLGGLRHILLAAKLELDLRSYHLLGLDAPDFIAAKHAVIVHNLVEGAWYLAITALVVLSIYSLRKSN
jgi:hypothetical protein